MQKFWHNSPVNCASSKVLAQFTGTIHSSTKSPPTRPLQPTSSRDTLSSGFFKSTKGFCHQTFHSLQFLFLYSQCTGTGTSVHAKLQKSVSGTFFINLFTFFGTIAKMPAVHFTKSLLRSSFKH